MEERQRTQEAEVLRGHAAAMLYRASTLVMLSGKGKEQGNKTRLNFHWGCTLGQQLLL